MVDQSQPVDKSPQPAGFIKSPNPPFSKGGFQLLLLSKGFLLLPTLKKTPLHLPPLKKGGRGGFLLLA
ncbi:hypothetical protein CXB77_10245 [Chromatium okenii]|uniref:Uncharacterized protein n=1 Tax=Chromatium okenii TaxID=61644 RepID=A0A2S7XRW8_9GAMM|nr:hypothetical protein CXB77_10245 [Chromatium okenii]